jgi:hypothetical protein
MNDTYYGPPIEIPEAIRLARLNTHRMVENPPRPVQLVGQLGRRLIEISEDPDAMHAAVERVLAAEPHRDYMDTVETVQAAADEARDTVRWEAEDVNPESIRAHSIAERIASERGISYEAAASIAYAEVYYP